MDNLYLQITLVLLLVLANGAFALAEIALVSARRARLQKLAQEGNAGARRALELMREPGRFLSTVQVGISLIGILAGAFGGATIAAHLDRVLRDLPLVAPYSRVLSLVLVVLAITYLSLVLGELAPKRFALSRPEALAARAAGPMHLLSRLAHPVVVLLSASTDLVLKILGVRPSTDPAVTEDEVRVMIAQGAETGVFAPEERVMVERIFRLGDRRVNAIMTPRHEVAWLNLEESGEAIRRRLRESGHSRFPVARGSLDAVVGVVQVKDLLTQTLAGEPLDLEAVMDPPLFVPEGRPALTLLAHFKQASAQMALVLDEFGGLEGLVTVTDVLEAVAGDLAHPEEHEPPDVVAREDGSWLVDGMIPIDELKDLLNLRRLPGEEPGGYQTLGGFIMTYLGTIPQAGDRFEWDGYRFEVMDMDDRRVDKVLIAPLPGEENVRGEEGKKEV